MGVGRPGRWRSTAFGLGLLLGLGAVGCGEDPLDDARLPEIDSPPQAETPAESASPLEAARGYYAAWGRCLQRTRARLDQSWARYTLDIDPERHRLRTRGVQPYLDTLDSQLDGCPLGTALPAEAPAALDTQGRAFVLSARGYNSRATEMAEYFDGKGYEEDEWADLERLGPALAKAHEEAAAAAAAFAGALDVQRDQADRLWLTQLAADTPPADSAAWQVTQTTVAARSTSHCLTPERPLPEACLKASAAFSTARASLEAYRAAHRAEAVGVFWLDVYRGHAETLQAALAKQQEPPPRRRRGAPTPPAPELEVAKTRAALLGAGDRVVFDFP